MLQNPSNELLGLGVVFKDLLADFIPQGEVDKWTPTQRALLAVDCAAGDKDAWLRRFDIAGGVFVKLRPGAMSLLRSLARDFRLWLVRAITTSLMRF